MASITDLPVTAEQLLSLFKAQLVKQGVQLPERQYVQAGSMPVWDGEQLTAGLMGITQGQPGQMIATSMVPEALVLSATFFILLVRKISVMQAEGFAAMEVPTAEDQDSDGQASMADAQALVLAAAAVHRQYLLTAPGEGFVIDALQPLGPEGGLAASRLLLSVSLS